ncbi:MAG: polymerase sigma-70 factor, subfamily, partial [Micromonosporaceae bacterium]|nr:polymerase sigma-70 factor, subfamily [Micromonosporaceae bacterium]
MKGTGVVEGEGGRTDPAGGALAAPVAPDDAMRPPQRPSLELGEVLEKALAGDEDAFRTMYRTLQPGLLRYLRGLVAHDAEDVASE